MEITVILGYTEEMKQILLLTIFLVGILTGLSSCASVAAVDAQVQLKPEEAWTVEVLISFFKEDADLHQENISNTLNQTKEGLLSQGVDVNWFRDDQRGAEGSAVYVINMAGNGFEKLSWTVLQKPGAVLLTRNGTDNNIDVSMTPHISLDKVKTVRYTIHGGEIIASNGTIFDQSTVYWLNPNGQMLVTMREPRRSNWLALAMLAGGVIFLGIAVFGLTNLPARKMKNSEQTHPVPVRQPGPGLAFCEHCQVEIPAQAAFCPNCGGRRQPIGY